MIDLLNKPQEKEEWWDGTSSDLKESEAEDQSKDPDILWHKDYNTLEKTGWRSDTLYISKNLKIIHGAVYPLPVIGQGAFRIEDFIKSYGKGFYLYSLDHEMANVHGGLFQMPIELLLHDLAHMSSHVVPLARQYIDYSPSILFNLRKEREIGKALKSYQAICSVTSQIIEGKKLSQKEENMYKEFVFYATHEITDSIPDLLANCSISVYEDSRQTCLNLVSLTSNIITTYHFPDFKNNSQQFYIQQLQKDPYSRGKTPTRIMVEKDFPKTLVYFKGTDGKATGLPFSGTNEYRYEKMFHMDTYKELRDLGFLPQPLKETELDYSATEIREAFHTIIKWVTNELEPNGKLYPYFSRKIEPSQS